MKPRSCLGLLLITLAVTVLGSGAHSSALSAFELVKGDDSIVSVSADAGATANSGRIIPDFRENFQRHNQISRQAIDQERIIKLKSGLVEADAVKIISGFGGKIKKQIYGAESTYVVIDHDQSLKKYATTNDTKIESMRNNLKMRAMAIPNDPFYLPPFDWNYRMMELASAWGLQKGCPNIIVAVLDTGIAPNHPDLQANLVAGYDFIDEDHTPWDTSYYDIDNQYSHGTHVAGIIDAESDNGVGIAGVAWNVKIMPIRVIDAAGDGSIADVAAGVNWAVDHGAQIINLSLGITGVLPEDPDAAILVKAIDRAILRDVTVISAAGNYGFVDKAVVFPANYRPVLAVAALDQTGSVASYSCDGPEIDIYAPGGGIPTTNNDEFEWASKTILSACYDKANHLNNYNYMFGTSMAAAHIAGLTALLYSGGIINPTIIAKIIKDAAVRLDNSMPDRAGKVNAYAALSRLGLNFRERDVNGKINR